MDMVHAITAKHAGIRTKLPSAVYCKVDVTVVEKSIKHKGLVKSPYQLHTF